MRPVEEWRVAELTERGKPHGLTPEQVQAADMLDMSLASYAAYANVVRNVGDHH